MGTEIERNSRRRRQCHARHARRASDSREEPYRIPHGGFTIEVDEFLGENAGLVVAEVELKREGQTFDKPAWLGKEVTGDPKYSREKASRVVP